MIVVGIMGVIIERFAYRPLRHAPRLAPLISAIGVSIFLQNAVLLWVDSKPLPFPSLFPVKPVHHDRWRDTELAPARSSS